MEAHIFCANIFEIEIYFFFSRDALSMNLVEDPSYNQYRYWKEKWLSFPELCISLCQFRFPPGVKFLLPEGFHVFMVQIYWWSLLSALVCLKKLWFQAYFLSDIFAGYRTWGWPVFLCSALMVFPFCLLLLWGSLFLALCLSQHYVHYSSCCF